LALNPSGELAIVGGIDGVAGIYSISEKCVVASLKGGGGSITDTVWIGSKAAIVTSAGVVKIFEDGAEVASFNSHAGEATAVAAHPTGDILASVGVDKSYILYDLTTKSVITQIFSDSGKYIPSHPQKLK
jgi:pre-mRNA-processing factor 19